MAKQNFIIEVDANLKPIVDKFQKGELTLNQTIKRINEKFGKETANQFKESYKKAKRQAKQSLEAIKELEVRYSKDANKKKLYEIRKHYKQQTQEIRKHFAEAKSLYEKDSKEFIRIKRRESKLLKQLREERLVAEKKAAKPTFFGRIGGGLGKAKEMIGGMGLGGLGMAVGGITAGVMALQKAFNFLTGKISDAVDESVEFETAMAGVFKTTGIERGTKEAIKLEKVILRLSKELPVSAAGLANIGEVAGQLGLPREQIAGFLEQIAKGTIALSKFNGNSELLAETIAKIGNSFKKESTDMSEFSAKAMSVLNELANTTAANEYVISEAVKRMTSASAVGIKSFEAMAFAATAIAGGLEPEVVATGMNAIIRQIGKQREKLASFMKMTAKDFDQAFIKAPSQMIIKILESINKIGDVAKRQRFIQQIFGDEAQKVVLKLGGSIDALRKNIETGVAQYNIADSLEKEFNVAMDTTEKRAQLAQNRLDARAIEMGKAFKKVLPFIANLKAEIYGIVESVAGGLAQIINLFQSKTADFEDSVQGIAKAMADIRVKEDELQSFEKLSNEFISLRAKMNNVKLSTEELAKAKREEKALLQEIEKINPSVALTYDAMKGSIDTLINAKNRHINVTKNEIELQKQVLGAKAIETAQQYNNVLLENMEKLAQAQSEYHKRTELINEARRALVEGDTKRLRELISTTLSISEVSEYMTSLGGFTIENIIKQETEKRKELNLTIAETKKKLGETGLVYQQLSKQAKELGLDEGELQKITKETFTSSKEELEGLIEKYKDVPEIVEMIKTHLETIGVDLKLNIETPEVPEVTAPEDVVQKITAETEYMLDETANTYLQDRIALLDEEIAKRQEIDSTISSYGEKEAELTDVEQEVLALLEDQKASYEEANAIVEELVEQAGGWNKLTAEQKKQIYAIINAHIKKREELIKNQKVLQQNLQTLKSMVSVLQLVGAAIPETMTNAIKNVEAQLNQTEKLQEELKKVVLPKITVPTTGEEPTLPTGKKRGAGKRKAEKVAEDKDKLEIQKLKEELKRVKEEKKHEEKMEKMAEKEIEDRYNAEKKYREEQEKMIESHYKEMESLSNKFNNRVFSKMTMQMKEATKRFTEERKKARTPFELELAFSRMAQRISNIFTERMIELIEASSILKDNSLRVIDLATQKNSRLKEEINLVDSLSKLYEKNIELQNKLLTQEGKIIRQHYLGLRAIEDYLKNQKKFAEVGSKGVKPLVEAMSPKRYKALAMFAMETDNLGNSVAELDDLVKDLFFSYKRLNETQKKNEDVMGAYVANMVNATNELIKARRISKRDRWNLEDTIGRLQDFINKAVTEVMKTAAINKGKYANLLRALSPVAKGQLAGEEGLTTQDVAGMKERFNRTMLNWNEVVGLISMMIDKNEKMRYQVEVAIKGTQAGVQTATLQSRQLAELFVQHIKMASNVQETALTNIKNYFKKLGYSNKKIEALVKQIAEVTRIGDKEKGDWSNYLRILSKQIGVEYNTLRKELGPYVANLWKSISQQMTLEMIKVQAQRQFTDIEKFINRMTVDLDKILREGLKNIRKKYSVEEIKKQRDLTKSLRDYMNEYKEDVMALQGEINDRREEEERKYWELRSRLAEEAFNKQIHHEFMVLSQHMRNLTKATKQELINQLSDVGIVALSQLKGATAEEIGKMFDVGALFERGELKATGESPIAKEIQKRIEMNEKNLEYGRLQLEQGKITEEFYEQEFGSLERSNQAMKERIKAVVYMSQMNQEFNKVIERQNEIRYLNNKAIAQGGELEEKDKKRLDELLSKEVDFSKMIEDFKKKSGTIFESLTKVDPKSAESVKTAFGEMLEKLKKVKIGAAKKELKEIEKLDYEHFERLIRKAKKETKDAQAELASITGNEFERAMYDIEKQGLQVEKLFVKINAGIADKLRGQIKTEYMYSPKMREDAEYMIYLQEQWNIARRNGDEEQMKFIERLMEKYEKKYPELAKRIKDEFSKANDVIARDTYENLQTLSKAMDKLYGYTGSIENNLREWDDALEDGNISLEEGVKLTRQMGENIMMLGMAMKSTTVAVIGASMGAVGALVSLGMVASSLYDKIAGTSDEEEEHQRLLEASLKRQKEIVYQMNRRLAATEAQKDAEEYINSILEQRLDIYDLLGQLNKEVSDLLVKSQDVLEERINRSIDNLKQLPSQIKSQIDAAISKWYDFYEKVVRRGDIPEIPELTADFFNVPGMQDLMSILDKIESFDPSDPMAWFEDFYDLFEEIPDILGQFDEARYESLLATERDIKDFIQIYKGSDEVINNFIDNVVSGALKGKDMLDAWAQVQEHISYLISRGFISDEDLGYIEQLEVKIISLANTQVQIFNMEAIKEAGEIFKDIFEDYEQYVEMMKSMIAMELQRFDIHKSLGLLGEDQTEILEKEKKLIEDAIDAYLKLYGLSRDMFKTENEMIEALLKESGYDEAIVSLLQRKVDLQKEYNEELIDELGFLRGIKNARIDALKREYMEVQRLLKLKAISPEEALKRKTMLINQMIKILQQMGIGGEQIQEAYQAITDLIIGVEGEEVVTAGGGTGAGVLTPIGGFQEGGKVEKTGVYQLHKGEDVITPKMRESLADFLSDMVSGYYNSEKKRIERLNQISKTVNNQYDYGRSSVVNIGDIKVFTRDGIEAGEKILSVLKSPRGVLALKQGQKKL